MADTKISALTSGNPAQSTDEIPIARSGANYKITAGSIASLAAAGSTTQVIFNDAGALAGDAGLTYSKSTDALTVAGKVVTPNVDAASSAGGQLRNTSGTSQLAWGAGGGSNLSLEVATNINPANASVSIAPTGTGTLTINPATAGTMNNVVIGGTTPAAGTFTDVTLNAQGDVRFADSDSSNWVAFQGPATVASNVTWTLPSADGTNGQVLSTNGSGTLSWASSGAGTVTSVAFSTGTTGLSVSGSPITSSGTITLAGTLAVANGGTGQTSYTNGQLLIGNTLENTLTKATLTAGSGISITNGNGSITIAATGSGGFSPVTAAMIFG